MATSAWTAAAATTMTVDMAVAATAAAAVSVFCYFFLLPIYLGALLCSSWWHFSLTWSLS